MRLLRLSLRYKFVFTLVGFTLLVAIPLGALSLMRFSEALEEQLVLRWETAAKGWLGVFESDLGLRLATPQERAEYCRILLLDQPELLVLHVTVGGTPICLVHSDEISDNSELQSLFFFKESPPAGISYEKHRLGNLPILKLSYTRPVVISDVLSGARIKTFSLLQFGLNMAAVQAQIRREMANIALIVLGYVLLGIVIAFVFYKMILGPVESLAEALKRFKRDKSARAVVRSGDELETLAQEFNQMADVIAERNQELEEMNLALSKANRAKSDFLAVMSHELKTPLHAIRGYSQLLLEGVDGPLTPAQREDLQNILHSGDHLLELIENILKFSKIEAGEDRPYFEVTDLSVIAEEAIKSVSALARKKGLVIESHVEPALLYADSTKLKQILLNLLSNAIKYTERGKVAVSGETHENEYLLTVSDTGLGIPTHERERIFEPFTQLDGSSTRESQGVGLGLAIVKKYVEMHGGRVWVESELGQGSRFFVALPLQHQLDALEEVRHAHSHR
ncbi:MAG: HAMP domain-containing sensor histidine kinase [Candidatus Bipolaricaulota bacterium]|nr:HAMP domain-containing sensor histidine kinase [Candidatus Bipolaricaulota bacterium]